MVLNCIGAGIMVYVFRSNDLMFYGLAFYHL